MKREGNRYWAVVKELLFFNTEFGITKISKPEYYWKLVEQASGQHLAIGEASVGIGYEKNYPPCSAET